MTSYFPVLDAALDEANARKGPSLPPMESPIAADDELVLLDRSDLTGSPLGTYKRVTIAQLIQTVR